MTGYIVVLLVGVAASGLYNMGKKARKQEESDEYFFRKQLYLAKKQCREIAWQFSEFLIMQRKRYLRKDAYGNLIYDDWIKMGIEPFFRRKVIPRLIDAQRDSLIAYGNYTEIIENVVREAQKQENNSLTKRLAHKKNELS